MVTDIIPLLHNIQYLLPALWQYIFVSVDLNIQLCFLLMNIVAIISKPFVGKTPQKKTQKYTLMIEDMAKVLANSYLLNV